MIFKHSLILPASENGGAFNAVNLMSTDMERIIQTLQWVLNIIPIVIQVGLGLWVLRTQLGDVSIALLVVAVGERPLVLSSSSSTLL
jgi:hypothetical protein